MGKYTIDIIATFDNYPSITKETITIPIEILPCTLTQTYYDESLKVEEYVYQLFKG